ncbi:MAG: hypothetical protein O9327_04970 [Polaromonas sp.]|jgi:hypothetical protein|nr:hypothetical protein [Polaromonas sp.]
MSTSFATSARRIVAGLMHLLARLLFVLAPTSMMLGMAHAAGTAMWSPSASEMDSIPIGIAIAIVAFLGGCALLSRSNQLDNEASTSAGAFEKV